MKQAVVQGGKGEPKLRVLDLASPGWHALLAYSERMPPGTVSLKAVDADPARKATDSKNLGFIKKALTLVDFTRKKALLPECLAEEPSNYYDHVHFHMFTTTGAYPLSYVCLGEGEAIGMINEINRIMKDGGLLFFSSDNRFEIDFRDIWNNEGNMRFLHNAISKAFRMLSFAITDKTGHTVVDSAHFPGYSDVLSLFKYKDKLVIPFDDPHLVRSIKLGRFISHFSGYPECALYFSIAKKCKSREI